MSKLRFIVIEGNIGVGKTTLSKKIAADYNAKLILERFAENPFLPKFYENQERYAFPVELSFLADRYHQLKDELANPDLFQPITIADYYFMKSLIFSKQTLSDDEYNLYRQLFDIIHKSLPKPDLFVYLSMSTERLLYQINLRGREYEQSITAEYLEKIHGSYLEFIKHQSQLTTLIIDANNLNFVNNPEHYQKITKAIFNTEYEQGSTTIIH
ncbi:MAG: deoxynucleoside kinase [Bacteroidia bacterium]|nr:deoxynucleoside kinase [Bacteroidia bacterium]